MCPPQTASPDASPGLAQKNLVSITPFFIVAELQASISHYIEPPSPIFPVTSPPTRTSARLTRCTTALISPQ